MNKLSTKASPLVTGKEPALLRWVRRASSPVLMLFQLLLTLAMMWSAPCLAAPPKVYICQGSASYAYHVSVLCEGLAWCTTSPKAISRAAAVKLGRRPCGRCAYQK